MVLDLPPLQRSCSVRGADDEGAGTPYLAVTVKSLILVISPEHARRYVH